MYLICGRASEGGLVQYVRHSDLRDRGLFEIFPTHASSQPLRELRERIVKDFYVSDWDKSNVTGKASGETRWLEWKDLGRKCGQFANCFGLRCPDQWMYHWRLAITAASWAERGLINDKSEEDKEDFLWSLDVHFVNWAQTQIGTSHVLWDKEEK